MKLLLKSATAVILIALVAGAFLSAKGYLHNRDLEREVRSAFALTGRNIDAPEIQAYLEKTFPAGTEGREIQNFIRRNFKRQIPDFSGQGNSRGETVESYMIDCGSRYFGTKDFMQLEFTYLHGLLEKIVLYDRSVAM